MLYFKRPYSTSFCRTVMHHQSVIFNASQVVSVIEMILPQTAVSSHPPDPQLVICFVSHNAFWDPLVDESEFVVFSPRLVVAQQEIVNTGKGQRSRILPYPSQPSTSFRLLSKIEIFSISSQSLSTYSWGCRTSTLPNNKMSVRND